MSSIGYPDYQRSRDYVAALIRSQAVASFSTFAVGTTTVLNVAASTRLLINSIVLEASVNGDAAGPQCYCLAELRTTKNFQGLVAPTTIVQLIAATRVNTSNTQALSMPGPVLIEGFSGGGNNLVLNVTANAAAQLYAAVYLYGIVV